MPTNFHLAPAVKSVGGMTATPIDIEHLLASIIFDGATSSAVVDATIDFKMGNTAGCPVFDLRQTIQTAVLDGVAVPIADIALHDFGGGAGADMRIINRSLAAGSSHQLQLTYVLGLPQSPAGGSYAPGYSWSAGPRLLFNFGFTDLVPARYLEAWLPSNLIFDQFSIELTLRIINSSIGHSVITNGTVTNLGTNHWKLDFPSRFTSLSPLLEVRATNTLEHHSDTVTLPVSSRTITIHAWKLTSGAANLTTQTNLIKTFLTDNENEYGPYLHDNRFTAFFHTGGMEYEGGTTTGTGALSHETFHSWWARGMKPASQRDAWWDEAWTTYFNDVGGTNSVPFDFTASPVLLCVQNEWSRATAGNAYGDGSRFWKGVSSMIGNTNLKLYMKDFFNANKNLLIRTIDLEAYLLRRSGTPQLVDAFHRFVYGFGNPATKPNLWLKDDVTDTTGPDLWSGRFWNSPNIWVRNREDGGTVHQHPEYGQDNWIYARVHNKSKVTVRHFVVAFNAKEFAGTQFSYPADFLPCIAVATGFELAPGASKVVSARWPRHRIPAPGTHPCLLAAVITKGEHPATNKFVWESNNLAQKNLTVVNLRPDRFFILPFLFANYIFQQKRKYTLEIVRPPKYKDMLVSLFHGKPKMFSHFEPGVSFKKRKRHAAINADGCEGLHLEAKAVDIGFMTDDNFESSFAFTEADWHEMKFGSGAVSSIGASLSNGDQLWMQLKLTAPASAKPGEEIEVDLVQRDVKSRKIVGGVSVLIQIN